MNELLPDALRRELLFLGDAEKMLGFAARARDGLALESLQAQLASLQGAAGRAAMLNGLDDERRAARAVAERAGRIKVRCEAEIGALDLDVNPHGGAREQDRVTQTWRPHVEPATRANWRKLGAVIHARGHDALNALLDDAAQDDVRGVTTAATLRLLAREARAERDGSLTPAPWPAGTFPVMCADPPWRYESGTTDDTREIENQYPTMTHAELCALEVPAAPDAVLFLWAPSPKLAEGLAVMAAWGFEYRTCMVWVKDRIGMGYYARQRHELLLIGKRGNPPVPATANRPDSVIEAPRGRHSAKPADAYERIARMFPELPRVELFARSPRPGWTVWGNET